MEVKTRIERRYVPKDVEVEYVVARDGREFKDTIAAMKHERWLDKKEAVSALPHFEYMDLDKEIVNYYYLSCVEDLNLLTDFLGEHIELTNNDGFYFPNWYCVQSYDGGDSADGYYLTDMDVMIDWIDTYLHNIETEFNKYVK